MINIRAYNLSHGVVVLLKARLRRLIHPSQRYGQTN
jgi:hypothetical protein